MTLVILAVGVLAIIESQQHFFMANAWSSQAATATFLAGEIKEYTRSLDMHDPVSGLELDVNDGTLVGWGPEIGETSIEDFDDVDDFDGFEFRFDGTPAVIENGVLTLNDSDLPGPINAVGDVIAGIDGGDVDGAWGWMQAVTVEIVDPYDFTQVAGSDFTLPYADVDVEDMPLRVTVAVSYQGPLDATPTEVAQVQWIVQ